MTTIAIAATLINDAYHASNDKYGHPILERGAIKPPAGWVLTNVIDHTSKGGDYAAIFVNATTQEVFIAGRGTAQLSDFKIDAEIVLGYPPTDRIVDAQAILSSIRRDPLYSGYTIQAGGHSLDGLVWAKVSERDDNPHPINVLVINAPNIAINNFIDINGDSHVTSIVEKNDVIGHFGPDFSNTIYVDGNVLGGWFNQAGTHGITNTLVEGVDKNIDLANQDLAHVDPKVIANSGVSGLTWGGRVIVPMHQMLANMQPDGSMATSGNDGVSLAGQATPMDVSLAHAESRNKLTVATPMAASAVNLISTIGTIAPSMSGAPASLSHLIQTMAGFTDGNTGIDPHFSLEHVNPALYTLVAAQHSGQARSM
ncbi:hypothetical protein ACVBEF_03350 [Glaciimonas sp. GG7]